MPLLIDCYNVLHAPMPPSLAGLDERGLCIALARSRWASTPAKIICDGSVKPGGPGESPVDGIDLIYSGKDKSADTLIEQLIAADSAPRRLLVVTSDRAIQKAAHRRRARVMPSDEFVRELAATQGRGRPGSESTGRPDLTQKLPPDEVQRWLKQFGINDERSEP